jgi:hypothetical protein
MIYMLRKKLFYIVFMSLIFTPSFVFGAGRITSFDVEVSVEKNGTIVVVEHIEYDFGSEQKHGIYRDIPTVYEIDGKNKKLTLRDIQVVNENEQVYEAKVSGSNPVRIKIGDSEKTITGKHTYVISYTVLGALRYFEDFDEVYWNATGDKWVVPIEKTSVRVLLPDGFSDEGSNQACYVGKQGSTARCNIALVQRNLRWEAVSSYEKTLNPGEGVTVAVSFAKGLVGGLSFVDALWLFIQTHIREGIILLIAFVANGYVIRSWFKNGRDPKGRGTIVPRYTPPQGISPMESGVVYDDKADPKDFVAEIIFLAIEGHLNIKRVKRKVLGIINTTDYDLIRIYNKKPLKPFQEMILEKLFPQAQGKMSDALQGRVPDELRDVVSVSSLKNTFYKDLKIINKELYKSVSDVGYYSGNPYAVKQKFTLIGIGNGGRDMVVWNDILRPLDRIPLYN